MSGLACDVGNFFGFVVCVSKKKLFKNCPWKVSHFEVSAIEAFRTYITKTNYHQLGNFRKI